jgi:putative oxidoreductase
MPSSERLQNLGLLLLRVGIGGMFMGHGWPKLAGGPDRWAKLGKAMTHLGIDFAPTAFGFAAAVSEFFGGLLIAVGLFFRPGCALLLGTMLVASTMHIRKGDSFGASSHAIEAAILFAALLLIGPGRYTLYEWIRRQK